MPFSFENLLNRFRESRQAGRLGHAYLLTGSSLESLEKLARALADIALEAPAQDHPDFYWIRPESKSRRITVQQIRTLEKALYLKPFRAPIKVAVITAADRMCLGQAEPANAFLKTLEEPPASTLLFLVTTSPSLLLPTIISRCLRLDLAEEESAREEIVHQELIEKWAKAPAAPPLRAYYHASLLGQYWNALKEKIDEQVTESAGEDESDEAVKGVIESEFQLARRQTLTDLQKWYWQSKEGTLNSVSLMRTIQALEDLDRGLQQNIDSGLALERACLMMEGLIPKL